MHTLNVTRVQTARIFAAAAAAITQQTLNIPHVYKLLTSAYLFASSVSLLPEDAEKAQLHTGSDALTSGSAAEDGGDVCWALASAGIPPRPATAVIFTASLVRAWSRDSGHGCCDGVLGASEGVGADFSAFLWRRRCTG